MRLARNYDSVRPVVAPTHMRKRKLPEFMSGSLGKIQFEAAYIGHGVHRECFDIGSNKVLKVETNYSKSNETEMTAFSALGPALAPEVFWVGDVTFEGKVYDACVLEKVVCMKDILQTDTHNLGNSHVMLIARAVLCLFQAALKDVVVRDCHAGNLGVRDSGGLDQVVVVDAGNSNVHKYSQKEVNQMIKNFEVRLKDLKEVAVDDAVKTVLAAVKHKDVLSVIDSLQNMLHKIDFLEK